MILCDFLSQLPSLYTTWCESFHDVFADAMNLPCICDINGCHSTAMMPRVVLIAYKTIYSLISVHLLCCALKPSKLWNISNILPSLVLPSKIFRALFQHSTIKVRCSKDFPWWIFYHHWCKALRFSCQFPYILPSVMVSSKVFVLIFEHQWCYAPRSFFILRQSTIFVATLQDLLFNLQDSTVINVCSKVFSPMFKHHRRHAIFNVLTSLTLRCQIFWSVCRAFHHHGWYAIIFSSIFKRSIFIIAAL